MERAGSAAGAALRAKSSLASVAGLAGFARSGNGSGLRMPLSCALEVSAAKNAKAHNTKPTYHLIAMHCAGALSGFTELFPTN
jgi:hypothetical protein